MSDVAARIFISYSRVDTDFVDKLQADLQSHNFDAWVDRQKIKGGDDWADTIQRAIKRCNIMVVVLSPAAIESEWVKNEYSCAQGQAKIPVIPILYNQIKEIPIGLNTLQWIDFTKDYEQGFRNLLNALTPITTQTRSSVASPTNVDARNSLTNTPNQSTPSIDLFALYREGVEANVNNDLDRAEILWKQVLASNPDFEDGLLQIEYDKLLKRLHPIRLQRLRESAQSATQEQDWQKAAGAWKKLLELEPSDRGVERD